MELHPSNLESLLPEGHHARLVWSYVEQQNLKGLYDIIKARQGSAGRSAIAPQILFVQARNRGLVLLPVRGRAKVKCVALWFALAHNFMRMVKLVPQLLGIGISASAIPAMTG